MIVPLRPPDPRRLVLIGYSAGGTQSVERLLSRVAIEHPPILLIQHIDAEFDRTQMEFQLRIARRGVGKEPRRRLTSDTVLMPGLVYVLSAVHQATFSRNLIGRPVIHLHKGKSDRPFTPCIDQVFIEAAAGLGPLVTGIILSGMLDDGAKGLLAIDQARGEVMVESPGQAAFTSMPEHATKLVGRDKVYGYDQMAAMIGGRRPTSKNGDRK